MDRGKSPKGGANQFDSSSLLTHIYKNGRTHDDAERKWLMEDRETIPFLQDSAEADYKAYLRPMCLPDLSEILRPIPRTPYRNYNRAKMKRKQTFDYLTESALTEKVSHFALSKKASVGRAVYTKEDECKAREEMIALFKATPVPPIQESWINNIWQLLPEKLFKKYKEMADGLLAEACEEYVAVSTAISLQQFTTQCEGEQRQILVHPIPYDHNERLMDPDGYKRLVNNNSLTFSLHRIMRTVNGITMEFFPDVFISVEKFRDADYHDVVPVMNSIMYDIGNRDKYLSNMWYGPILVLITDDRVLDCFKKERSKARMIRLLSCYISSQVLVGMENTIEYFCKSMSCQLTAPKMTFHTKYMLKEHRIRVYPSRQELVKLMMGVVKEVSSVCQELPCFEPFVLEHYEGGKYIKVKRYDTYLVKIERRIRILVNKITKPMCKHYRKMEKEFSSFTKARNFTAFLSSLSSEKSFEELFRMLKLYQEKADRLKLMPVYVYFGNIRVNQSDVIIPLLDLANHYTSELISELVFKHVRTTISICQEFEKLSNRAVTIPRTTAELVAVGKYMTYCSTVFMRDIKLRVSACLSVATRIMEFADFAPSHMILLGTAMTWLDRIKPVFESYSSMYEQTKFELEEHLQRTTDKLNREIEEVVTYLDGFNYIDTVDSLFDYMKFVSWFLRKIEDFDVVIEWINNEEALLKLALSTYPELDEIKAIVYPLAKLVLTVYKWLRICKHYMDGPFEELELTDVEDTVDEYYKALVQMQKTFKSKCKQQANEGYSKRFSGTVDDPDFNLWPAPLKLTSFGLQSLKDFRKQIQVVGIMCNPAMTEKHWKEMSELCGFDITPDYGTTLRKLESFNLDEFIDLFEIISVGAKREYQLQQNLIKMKAEWSDVCFQTSKYKDTGLPILSGIDDIQALLDDHLIKTLSMRGSAFVKPVEAEVREWYELLDTVNKTIDEWGKVQIQWLYLLPIFSSKDIIAQMPEEGILFQDVDQTYRNIMKQVSKEPHVLLTAGAEALLPSLKMCTENLEQINIGVNNYLEKKRLFFPRFFFLSNDEMLEILSETKDPLRVQPHLRKCFEGISKLGFDKELNIYSMFSAEGEEIPVVSQISTAEARGSVEKWLIQVESQMMISIRHVIEKSFESYTTRYRSKWVVSWPGQVVLCVSQIYWTSEVHACLRRQRPSILNTYHNGLAVQLNNLIALVRGRLNKQARITLGALVVLDVHSKDVTLDLYEKQVASENDFKWLAQLRYYWENDVIVRITNASVNYAYEYLGNTLRLVITPLTDRCYRTLIGAYHLHLNGAPEGPAGTGKTETTKDLAKAIAVQCVVFNCSDGLDYIAMGKFFKGLASSGAWACFDEFNRIEIEVLSVIAQQILCIVQAVRNKMDTFVFEGTQLSLNPSCYVCITMNPGYAGRSELPDNLKVLFRTVAMMVPDYALIGEISLYSYGFLNARILSVKIVTTYRLCSEQLSSQSHYDYGMRAVKTVLSAAGNLKLKFPKESEDILLLRSITDVNLPKFLNHDVPLFEGIISDLFPGIVLPTPNYDNHMSAINVVCKRRNLQPRNSFLVKIIQTYEMMIVRHGFMLVGEPFGGKTSTLHVLADTLTLMHERGEDEEVTYFVTLNPKSVTMGQLYGQFDAVSHEWSDGIIATSFREYAMSPLPDRKWVIFDGPVDAVWIENMNTVLDDNKKLCLNSGEVIQMTHCMSMIFEVSDLAQASPATVSRCGMIYMEPSTLGWRPLVESWNREVPPEWIEDKPDRFLELFDWLLPPTIRFVAKQCRKLCEGGIINSVKTTVHLIEMILKDACENVTDFKHIPCWTHAAFLIGVTWGIGGTLDLKSRDQFDEFHKDIWRGNNEEFPIPETLDKIEIIIPSEGNMHDYTYQFKARGQWKYWPEVVKGMKADEGGDVLNMLVPTVETVKYLFITEMHTKFRIPFLITGPTGTGKSFYVQNLLMKLPLESFVPGFLAFTASTSANLTQDLVISKLIKRKRGVYGAPVGKLCILFVDDINMPAKETYGAQPAIELLRQYFDHKHWYDLKDTTKIFLKDIIFVAAMGLPGGSRQEIYPRFLRHFCLYSINSFSEESTTKIFSSILFNGLRKNGFSADVIPLVQTIVSATMVLYLSAIDNLLPTPAKSHYVFNIRDFARVINGHLLMRKEAAEVPKKTFVRLWVHETLRVFYDRLIDSADKEWFYKEVRNTVKENFRENFDTMLDNLGSEKEVSEEDLRNLLFTTALDLDADEERKYEEIPSIESFYNVAMMQLDEYNAIHKTKMNIVLFRYALEHLSRICRVLSMPSGSALLVGVGGSGRQSLTRLAATMCAQTVFQPEISKSYGFNEWRDDLKRVLKESGGRNKNTVFLFTEGQIKADYFLQDIDSLLNSGEVPNIFPIDEVQEVLEMVRLAAQGGNRNLDISPLVVFSYFIKRCKRNLHILLCFSPIGSAFRIRLRLYPSLVNCCTVDWFEGWPEDALEKVAQQYLSKVNLDQTVKTSAVTVCKYFHVTAREMSDRFFSITGRKTYITSASYLDLIRAYTDLVTSKQDEIMSGKMRYIKGLEKLDFAAAQVSIMQKDLEELQPQLKKAALQTQAMLKVIEHETIEVEKTSERVREDEKVANAQAAAATALKTECENDLAIAIPILEDALTALNTLKPADITLVKAMKNPPDPVKMVMAAVCVMKDIKPEKIPDPNRPGEKIMDYWGPSKRLLGEMTFLQQLKDYDKDNIPASVMNTIRKVYLPNKDFKPSIVAKASSAAEGLCKWIIALDKYDIVVKEVAPKKAKLLTAEEEFAKTMAILEAKRAQLKILEDKLAKLNADLAAEQAKKQRLEDEVALCSSKLEKAKKIIGSLGGEKDRWYNAAEGLQQFYNCIPGDILVSCGIIAYLAPFTTAYRHELVNKWRDLCIKLKIPSSPVYTLATVLGSDIKIQTWSIYGLPRDAFSVDNAIILANSMRWSLLVDPQGQANKWIKSMEKENDLEVIKLSDDTYMKRMESCIEYGKPILLENIAEDLDPPLDPILLKEIFKQGNAEYISLGENVIEYNRKFRFYITTKLRNPHYLPEVFNKVTLINFALTMDGLADQLLGIVVAKERPDLEQKMQTLIVEGANNRKALKEVEDSILETLSSVKGNILEDETAVNILDSSKTLSKDIIQKQEAAKETQVIIEKCRLDYTPFSDHSSCLYYTITDLPNVDPMYQYSLVWFINIFINSIETASVSPDITKRIGYLKETFNYSLYLNVCRSLFNKDKTLYSFILCTTLMTSVNKLQKSELDFLMTGGIGLENPVPNPAPDWLSDKSWDELCRVEEFTDFKGISGSFISNLKDWKFFYDLQDPTCDDLPLPWRNRLTEFQKLIMLRIMRPDRLVPLIVKFVEIEIGKKFIQPPVFDIFKSYMDSNSVAPLIFILSPGVDPMQALLLFAQKMDYSEKFDSISLGQGQGPIALTMIRKAQNEGSWVCLQNCHLATSWMPALEKICDNFDPTNTHSNFRIWLTSYPSAQFPVSILQNGVKMTNEAPEGLQQSLIRSYTSDPVCEPDFYESCQGKEQIFAKLLFGITFFHAVVQERRKFGPIGWNIPYGFNESDYLISIHQLQMYVMEYADIPYEAVTYLTGECNYGGRVTDNWDRRALNTLLAEYINPDVVFNPDYSLVEDDRAFTLPLRYDYREFIKFIDSLPASPTPEVFGLHSNAGITRNLNDTGMLLEAMLLVKGEAVGGDSGKSDQLIYTIAHDINSKVPPPFDLDAAMTKYPTEYTESMNTVLVQEMERFNRLLRVISGTLVAIQKAIKGVVAMSPELEALYNSLLISKIPAAWAKVSYPSLKPLGSYVNDFLERIKFLHMWYLNGKPPNFWLSGFFFTQAFLTGAMQNYARRYTIPIDQLVYDFKILKVDKTQDPPSNGVFVYGLFLEGARWDRKSHSLAEQYPKILSDTMPLIWIVPCRKEELNEGGRYVCPLYKTTERKGVLSTTGHSTNYVLPILIETRKPTKHWVKRGVALMCQLSD